MSWYFVPLQRDELQNMFPLKPRLVEANGYGNGKILKFQTFYLKIYPDNSTGRYIVQAYLYNKVNPVFIDRIYMSQMRKYAQQFTREDYLRGMIAVHERNQYSMYTSGGY